MALEALIADLITALNNNTAAVQGSAGAALVNTPPAGDGAANANSTKAKTTYYHLVDQKKVVKIGPKAEKPIGGLEISAAQFADLEAKYAAGNGAAGAGEAAGNAQGQAAGATGGQTGGTSEGPTFQSVTDAITALSKKEGGRAKVVDLLARWGVKRFPEVQGKKPNADLLADIASADAPPAGENDDLGL